VEDGSQSVLYSRPRTYIGLWLRASLLGESETYRRLGQRLNGGKAGWNDDEPAVVEAACELAAQQLFGSEYDGQMIADFVSGMRTRITRGKVPPSQEEMEAAVRAAVGDRNSDSVNIKRSELFNIRVAVLVNISDGLSLDSEAIDVLLVNAEVLARRRGWVPPLAA
jgi:hypothetical protein